MMIRIRIKTLLVITVILFFYVDAALPQVVVERSNEKVIISGSQYYVHRVKKGETAYSISRAYGITVETLIKENPPAVYGLNEGQVLKIPVVAQADKQPSVQAKVQKDETRFIYHPLKPGETVYYLSRAYGVSENEIMQSNPGLEINKLPVGSEIAIPRRDFMIEKEKFASSDKNYFFHKVVRGETLASIARDYDMSLRDLRKENRDMRFPQVGDYVRIPRSKAPAEPLAADTISKVPETVEQPVFVKPSGYTPVTSLSGTMNIAVMLPFYFRENDARTMIDSSKVVKGKKIYKTVNLDQGWIYPPSQDFIEMFEGILLATDTLRALGININLYPFDIKSDTLELSKIIRSGKLEKMDLIIGPVYSYNLTRVAAYARERGIPVVSPVPLINNSSLADNPTLFMAFSSLAVAQKALAKKISENPSNNIVFIHSDTLGTDTDIKNFKSTILSEVSSRIPAEEIRFKEFIFYNRSKFGNDSINRLSHALSDRMNNTIVIASEEAPVISETMMDIHGLSKKYNVAVYGYPYMRNIENLDPKYFFDLDIELFSPYWIDYSQKDVKQFNADYRQKFLTEPKEDSFAWYGYDLTYYFISGLAIHGRDFVAHPEIHNPDLLQTEFDFARKWPDDGFENQKLFLIHFTRDYNIMLMDGSVNK